MTDIEKRAQEMLNDIQRRKQAMLADKVFREPEWKKAKEQAKKEAEEREQKARADMWSPWIAKAQERMQQKQADHEKMINKYLS